MIYLDYIHADNRRAQKLSALTLSNRCGTGKNGADPVGNGKTKVSLKLESKRRKEIKVPIGKQETIRYEIFAFNSRIYPRSGHPHVWLTDDKRRMPVQIQVRLQFTIGTISLKLDKEMSS